VLPEVAAQYFLAAQALVARNRSTAALHKFRLRTKRFRYTLELFHKCYGPGLSQRLKTLQKIQQHLGHINDCATTIRMLSGKGHSRPSRLLARFLRHLDAEVSSQSVALTEALKHYLQSEQQRWWTAYLARPAESRKS
jgi:CHAD domain-containing protein